MTGFVLHRNGLTVPKRQYAALHSARLMPLLAAAMQPFTSPHPDAVLAWAGFQGYRLAPQRRNNLTRRVGRNPYGNSYHHPWHSLTVVMNAAILAERAGVRPGAGTHQRDALLMAALCHDLEHRGKRAFMADYVEERRAAAISIRSGFGSGSGRRKDADALKARIDSTAAIWRKTAAIEPMIALLRDADIMASCFSPRRIALDLSRRVMREKGLAIPAANALSGFLKVMEKRGFDHPATRRLASTMSAATLGIGHAPDVAIKLGFRMGGSR